VLVSSVFQKGTSADTVEALIFWVLYNRVDHPLNVIDEGVVANESESQGLILNLLDQKGFVEEELPG
jgi:hypothetical protein